MLSVTLGQSLTRSELLFSYLQSRDNASLPEPWAMPATHSPWMEGATYVQSLSFCPLNVPVKAINKHKLLCNRGCPLWMWAPVIDLVKAAGSGQGRTTCWMSCSDERWRFSFQHSDGTVLCYGCIKIRWVLFGFLLFHSPFSPSIVQTGQRVLCRHVSGSSFLLKTRAVTYQAVDGSQ